MRNIVRSFCWIAVISSFALLLVHLKISLFYLSYRIDQKEERLAELEHHYERLDLRVKQLRSPAQIEAKVEDLKLGLSFPQDIQVVKYQRELVAARESH